MLASVVCSAQQTTLTPWAKFQFMSGSWNAVGSGTPGEGAGEFSFAFDLQNKVHVIRYVAQFSGDGNTCSPVSEPSPPQPRFRLIYQKLKEGQLAIRFDIASPDQPNNFKNYVAGTATLKDAAVPRRQANPAGPVRLTDDLIEFFSGDWIGSGEFASGKKIEADVNFTPDLDRQWLVYRHTDRTPNKYKALGMWGFETASSRFVMIVTDNFGGARRFSSDGWVNGKVVFEKVPSCLPPADQATSSGANIRERFTFERRNSDTFKMTYETSLDGTNWRLGDYLVFKRKR